LIRTIGSVSMSSFADNFFILHIPTEYDYLFVSNKKTEIIVRLMALYERIGNKSSYRLFFFFLTPSLQ